jgi:hypothetical protein
VKILIIAAALLLGESASAAEVDITKGQLTHDGPYSTQIVGAKNNTNETIQTLWVECGFFRKGALLGAGAGYAENLTPAQSAYIEVAANHTEGADSADCRLRSTE